MFPIISESFAHSPLSFLLYLGIGFAFGFVLESAGFGDSRKLAGQFYFKDLAVLRVMFTAIITAAILLAFANSTGLLVLDALWIPPTWLSSALIGGTIMGAGFIVGGYCPGTSLVAAATLKIDAFFFVGGALFGMFLFGESNSFFNEFWRGGYYGRLSLMDVFGWNRAEVTVAAVLLALAMFSMATLLRRHIYRVPIRPGSRIRGAAQLSFLLAAIVLTFLPETNLDSAWASQPEEIQQALNEGQFAVLPAEVLSYQHKTGIELEIVDLRSEEEYNTFHLRDARALLEQDYVSFSHDVTSRSQVLTILIGANSAQAEVAWRHLHMLGVANLYYLSGGIDSWLDLCAEEAEDFIGREATANGGQVFHFARAMGAKRGISRPHAGHFPLKDEDRKITMKQVASASGGCG